MHIISLPDSTLLSPSPFYLTTAPLSPRSFSSSCRPRIPKSSPLQRGESRCINEIQFSQRSLLHLILMTIVLMMKTLVTMVTADDGEGIDDGNIDEHSDSNCKSHY
jgi:hypothetical protein